MVLISPSLRSGPLALYVDGFARELLRQGYTVNGAGHHLRFVAHLNTSSNSSRSPACPLAQDRASHASTIFDTASQSTQCSTPTPPGRTGRPDSR
jgi:hypothetical protein